jgi:hypothetical protein
MDRFLGLISTKIGNVSQRIGCIPIEKMTSLGCLWFAIAHKSAKAELVPHSIKAMICPRPNIRAPAR